MGTKRSSDRLIRLFEQELRAFESDTRFASEVAAPRRRVSRELEVQVAEFVAEEQKDGRTPEQMLIELKALLARVAPEVPGSQRNALLASVTGRAITAFFQSQRSRSPGDGRKARTD
jgi:hypothetical protein